MAPPRKPGKLDLPPPIIVKKVTIVAAGHHGGAWKVAYADFVTAMMAFFLLLWLLGLVSAVPVLAADAAPVVQSIIDRLGTLLQNADSLEAYLAALSDAFGDLPVDDLTKVMEMALAAAQLAGMADVADGA